MAFEVDHSGVRTQPATSLADAGVDRIDALDGAVQQRRLESARACPDIHSDAPDQGHVQRVEECGEVPFELPGSPPIEVKIGSPIAHDGLPLILVMRFARP